MNAPAALTAAQVVATCEDMRRNGSGFASRLAEAWQYADTANRARIESAFGDVIARHWQTFQREIARTLEDAKPARVVHAWNTGRAYTAKGQRIAATLVDVDGLPYWIFEDADRHISGAAHCLLPYDATDRATLKQARADVMREYDNSTSWDVLCTLAAALRRDGSPLLSDLRPVLVAACDALPAAEQVAR